MTTFVVARNNYPVTPRRTIREYNLRGLLSPRDGQFWNAIYGVSCHPETDNSGILSTGSLVTPRRTILECNLRGLKQLFMFYTYILTNVNNTVLYVGVTNNLIRRTYEHKQKLVDGFTKKYNVNKLIYFEQFSDVRIAIQREKQLKSFSRIKKINLINQLNPEWIDLYNSILDS